MEPAKASPLAPDRGTPRYSPKADPDDMDLGSDSESPPPLPADSPPPPNDRTRSDLMTNAASLESICQVCKPPLQRSPPRKGNLPRSLQVIIGLEKADQILQLF